MPSRHASRHFRWGGLSRGYARPYAWRLLYTTYLGPPLIAHALRACLRAFSSGKPPRALCTEISSGKPPKALGICALHTSGNSHGTCPQGMPKGIFVGEASQGVMQAICMAIAVHYVPRTTPHSTCPQGMPKGIFVGKASQGVMHGDFIREASQGVVHLCTAYLRELS